MFTILIGIAGGIVASLESTTRINGNTGDAWQESRLARMSSLARKDEAVLALPVVVVGLVFLSAGVSALLWPR